MSDPMVDLRARVEKLPLLDVRALSGEAADLIRDLLAYATTVRQERDEARSTLRLTNEADGRIIEGYFNALTRADAELFTLRQELDEARKARRLK